MSTTFADLSQPKAVTILRILYPIWTVLGLFSLAYVPSALINFEDVATTANNLLVNGQLFNLGLVGRMITQLIHIVVVLVLFELFKSVNKNQAVLIVLLGLLGVPISMLNDLCLIAARAVLSGADYLAAFTAQQSESLMMFFLNLNQQGIYIASIFWGLWLLPIGTLTYESKYFPKFIGHALIIAGIAYTLDSLARLLFPSTESIFFQITQVLILGEVVFMLWVVVRGAKLPKTTPNT
jgi:hypothetical protein